MIYNCNGQQKKGNAIETSIFDRGMNYGDGIFETLKFSNNRINFWEDHYFRMMSSMRILRMEIPMSFAPEFIEKECRDLISVNGLQDKAVRIKILVLRKPGGRYTPDTNDVDYYISLEELSGSSFALNDQGLEVDLYKDFYKQKGMLSNLKLSSAPLFTLASIYKKENELDECLILNDEKYLAEAISSNIFLLKGGKLLTPSLASGCLKGIVRKKVLEIAKQMKLEVEEIDKLSPFDLQKSEEVFLTNSINGIQWVAKYKKKEFKKDLSSTLVAKLNIMAALS